METPKSKLISVKEVYKGKWQTLKVGTFRTINNTLYDWEYLSKPPHLVNHNGSMVIPIMKKGNQKFFIMIANFRPPANAYCIEFPGGLADEGETMEQCVRRSVHLIHMQRLLF